MWHRVQQFFDDRMSNPPTSSQDTVKPSSQPLSETTTNPLSKDLTENNLLSVWEKIRALYEQRFKPSSSPRHDLHSSPVSDDGSTQQNSSDISSSTRSSESTLFLFRGYDVKYCAIFNKSCKLSEIYEEAIISKTRKSNNSSIGTSIKQSFP